MRTRGNLIRFRQDGSVDELMSLPAHHKTNEINLSHLLLEVSCTVFDEDDECSRPSAKRARSSVLTTDQFSAVEAQTNHLVCLYTNMTPKSQSAYLKTICSNMRSGLNIKGPFSQLSNVKASTVDTLSVPGVNTVILVHTITIKKHTLSFVAAEELNDAISHIMGHADVRIGESLQQPAESFDVKITNTTYFMQALTAEGVANIAYTNLDLMSTPQLSDFQAWLQHTLLPLMVSKRS